MNEKYCSHCNRTLPVESFYVRKNKAARRCYCKECCSELTIAYQKANHDKILKINKKSKKKHRGQRIADVLMWQAKNKDKVLTYKRKNNEKRRSTIAGRLRDCITSGIRRAIEGKKTFKTFSILPYTPEQVVAHLLKTIPRGYTIDDFMKGKLHIDHIIPVSAFNITDGQDIDFQRCWALDNLRFLPAKENLQKGAHLDRPFQPSLAMAI
jgi:hypothetical protein